MSADAETLHLGLAAVGAGIAVVGIVATRRWPNAAATVTSGAALAMAAVLVSQGQAPWILVLAVALSAAAAHLEGPVAWVSGGVGLLTFLLALQEPSKGAPVLVLIVGVALVIAARRERLVAAAFPTALVVGAALLGSAAGAPDTEAVAIGVTALVPTYAGALLVLPQRARFDHHALLLLAAWAVVDGYRGRPAGLTAAIVAIAALCLPALGVLATRNRPVANWLLAIGTLIACVVAGRTIGLEDYRTVGATIAAVVGALVIVAAADFTARTRAPGTPGA